MIRLIVASLIDRLIVAMALVMDWGRWWSKSTVAVVTGSNKGLGEAIALTLARNGVTVVSTARDSARGLAAVHQALEAEPELKEFLHFHQLDVTADQSVAELASYLRTTFGGIDILVSCLYQFESTFPYVKTFYLPPAISQFDEGARILWNLLL